MIKYVNSTQLHVVLCIADQKGLTDGSTVVPHPRVCDRCHMLFRVNSQTSLLSNLAPVPKPGQKRRRDMATVFVRALNARKS